MPRELVMHGRLTDAKHIELEEPAGLRGEVEVILRSRRREAVSALSPQMDKAEDQVEEERSEWEGFGQGA